MKRCLVWPCVIGLCLGLAVPAAAEPSDVEAKSAVLMEVSTGTVLYEQNSHEPLAPASVTKVMTMLLIMEAIDSGRIGWDDMVTASESAAAKGGSQVYLKVGETMKVSEMLKSIAVSSANDCACAMAEHLSGSESAFVDQMNRRAKELGMQDTRFVNCTGLDDAPESREHRTSAYDIALMSRELLGKHPDIRKFTTIWMDTIRNGSFGLSNTNKLIRFYPGATGLKTGFTSGAGYCLSASAQREGMELVAVVMGCETAKGRNAACKGLLDYGFANYTLVQPELPENCAIPLTLGTEETVQPVIQDNSGILIEKGQKSDWKVELDLPSALEAPIAAGQVLGSARILSGDTLLCQKTLIADHAVEKLTFRALYRMVLDSVFG